MTALSGFIVGHLKKLHIEALDAVPAKCLEGSSFSLHAFGSRGSGSGLG
jgi:hypothetical protein